MFYTLIRDNNCKKFPRNDLMLSSRERNWYCCWKPCFQKEIKVNNEQLLLLNPSLAILKVFLTKSMISINMSKDSNPSRSIHNSTHYWSTNWIYFFPEEISANLLESSLSANFTTEFSSCFQRIFNNRIHRKLLFASNWTGVMVMDNFLYSHCFM